MPNSPGLELESLFLRIYIEGRDTFARAANDVRQGASRIEKAFAAIESKAGTTTAALGTVTGAVEALGAGLRSVAQVLTTTAMGNLTATLAALSNNTISLNLSKLAKGMTELAAVDVSKTAQNLAGLATGLKDSKLGTKSVSNVTKGIENVAQSVSLFVRQVGTGDTIRTIFTNVGEGVYQLGSKLQESKLHLKAATTATASLSALAPALQTLAGVAPNATIIKDQVAPMFGILGEALNKSKLSNKAAYAAIPTVGLLGQAIQQIPTARGRIRGLESIVTWLRSLDSFIQSKTLNVKAAQPIINVVEKLGAALGSVGTSVAGNAAANVVQLTTALNTLAGLNTGALQTSFTLLNTQLPGLGTAIRASGLGGTKSIANIAANITGFTKSLGALAAMQPAQLQASAVAMTNWIKTLTAGIGPAQLAVLTAMGKALTAINKAGAAGGILPTVNMTLNATANTSTRAAAGVNRLSSGFNQLGRSAIGARTSLTLTQLTLAGFAGFGLIQFARFDEAIGRALARMGDFSDAVRDRLRSAVLGLSTSRTTGADQLASAFGVLHATGMNQPMAEQALPIVEDFAQVAGIDATRAARALTSTLGALGMASMDASRDLRSLRDIADAFVHTSQIADTTVEELTEAFSGRFAAALRQVGWGMREGLTLITAYAQANVRGADAGNRASIVLQSLEHALIGHTHAWEALGLTVDQFTGLMHQGPAAVFSELEKRLQGLTPVQQRARLELLGFESRVTQALYPILGLSESMRLVSDGMRDLSGTSERAANIIRQSFGAQIKIVWNNVKALAIDIGDTLAPAIGWLSRQLKTLTDWFRNLNPQLQRLLVWGTLFVTIIGPLTAVAGTLLGILGSVVSIVGAFLTLKITLAGIGITILAILSGLSVTTQGIFLSSIGSAVGWRNIRDFVASAWSKARGFAGTMFDIAEKTAGFFVNWEENLKTLSNWFDYQGQTSYRDFGEILATIVRDLMLNFEQYLNWFGRNWKNLWDDASTVVAAGLVGVGRAFNVLMDTLRQLWSAFWETEAGNAVQAGLGHIGENFQRWLSRTGEQRQALTQGRETLGIGNRNLSNMGLEELEATQRRLVSMSQQNSRDLIDLSRQLHITVPDILDNTIASRNALVDTEGAMAGPLRTRLRNARLTHFTIDTLLREFNPVVTTRQAGVNLPERMRAAVTFGGIAPFQTEALPSPIPITIPTIGQGRMRQLMTVTAAMGGMTPFGAAATNLLPMTAFPGMGTFNFNTQRRPNKLITAQASATQAMATVAMLVSLGLPAPPELTKQITWASVLGILPGRRFRPFPQPSEGDSLFGGIGAPMRAPGHEFRSMSLSRFVFGGSATARIEQQVRDTELDKRLQNTNNILQDIRQNTAPINPLERRDPPQSQVGQGLAP